MFSTLKIAHVAHLVGLKVFTAKTVVGLGMVAGTAATGYVISDHPPDDYIDRTILLINHAVAAESGVMDSAFAMADVGLYPHEVSHLAPVSRLKLDTGPIGVAHGAGDMNTRQRAVDTSEISQPSTINRQPSVINTTRVRSD